MAREILVFIGTSLVTTALVKETYDMAKETYDMAKETYDMAKETYQHSHRTRIPKVSVCVSVKRGLPYGKRDLLYAQKRPTDILAYLRAARRRYPWCRAAVA